MTKQNKIQLFEQKQVRTVWDEEQEKWYFSIVDVVGILTDSNFTQCKVYSPNRKVQRGGINVYE